VVKTIYTYGFHELFLKLSMETIDRYSDTKLDVPLCNSMPFCMCLNVLDNFDVMLNAKTINEIVFIDFQFFFLINRKVCLFTLFDLDTKIVCLT
jgi:hypothetical protein